jgi:GAF domain-containing protein
LLFLELNASFAINTEVNHEVNASIVYFVQVCEEVSSFYKNIFGSLTALAITHSQESELQNLLKIYLHGVEKFKSIFQIQNIREGQINNSDVVNFNKLFNNNLCEIKEKFNQILCKIQVIAGKSFQNYKIKDVCGTFQILCTEFHRLSLLDFLPRLSLKFTELKFSLAAHKLCTLTSSHNTSSKKSTLCHLISFTDIQNLKQKAAHKDSLLRTLVSLYKHTRLHNKHRSFTHWLHMTLQHTEDSNTEGLVGLESKQSSEYIHYLSAICNDYQNQSSLFFHLHHALKDATNALYADFLLLSNPLPANAFASASSSKSPFQNSFYSVIPRAGFQLFKRSMDYVQHASHVETVVLGIKNPGIAYYALSNVEVVNVPNLYEDRRFDRKVDSPFLKEALPPVSSAQGNGIASCLCVPVVFGEQKEILGLIRIFGNKKRKFNQKQIDCALQISKEVSYIVKDFVAFHKEKTLQENEMRARSENVKKCENTSKNIQFLLRNSFQLTLIDDVSALVSIMEDTVRNILNIDDFELFIYDKQIDAPDTYFPQNDKEKMKGKLFLLSRDGKKKNYKLDSSEESILIEVLIENKHLEFHKTEIKNAFTRQIKQIVYIPIYSEKKQEEGVMKLERYITMLENTVELPSTENKNAGEVRRLEREPKALFDSLDCSIFSEILAFLSSGLRKILNSTNEKIKVNNVIRSFHKQNKKLSTQLLMNSIHKLHSNSIQPAFNTLLHAFQQQSIQNHFLQIQSQKDKQNNQFTNEVFKFSF